MTKKFKIPRKYRNKVRFTARLMIFALAFFVLWMASPNFYLMKRFTAQLVSTTTGAELIDEMDGIFVRKGDFLMQIVTDCTAWKEIFVFLALFIAWPKKKKNLLALKSIALILFYNLIRLDILVIFPGSFDYFHPSFQYISISIILYLWLWSIGLTKKNKLAYALGLKERKKRKKVKKPRKTSKIKTKAKKKKRKK